MSQSKKVQKQQKSQSDQDKQAEKLFDKPVKERNDEGQIFWALGNNKRVTISQFKGKTYVNIREYYQKDGELLPTKKGISLSSDQWQQFKKVYEDIDKQYLEAEGSKGKKKVKR